MDAKRIKNKFSGLFRGQSTTTVRPNSAGPVVYLHNALGDPDCSPPRPCPVIPQLIINGDCDVVGVADSTWGSVKSLYR